MSDEELNKLAAETVADMKAAGKAVSAEDLAAIKEAFRKDDGPQGFLGIPGFIRRALAGIAAIHALVSNVVDKVEEIAVDIKMAGAEKKALAVKVLNLLIDIPYVPENIEAWIFSYTIDIIVRELNKRLGNDWMNRLKLLAGKA